MAASAVSASSSKTWAPRKLSIRSLGQRSQKRASLSQSLSDAPLPPVASSPSKLLDLPSELLIAIFSSLEFPDLCALARTNRSFNHVLAAPESDVAKYLVASNSPQASRYFAQRPADGLYWRQYVQTTRRYNNAAILSEHIKNFFQTTVLYHNAQRNLRIRRVAKHVSNRMTPYLYTISVYLSLIKELVLSRSLDFSPAMVLREIQSQIKSHTIAMLKDIPLSELSVMHHTWLFLIWLIRTLVSRPSYAGTFERALRGWSKDTLDSHSIVRVLLFGNLPAVKRLMRLRDYDERRQWAEGFLRSLDSDGSVKWKHNWATLETGVDTVPSAEQVRATLQINLPLQCLWTEGAIPVFRALGDTDALADDSTPAINAATWISELAGYDIFSQDVPAELGQLDDANDLFYGRDSQGRVRQILSYSDMPPTTTI